jgi:hypothetical protein
MSLPDSPITSVKFEIFPTNPNKIIVMITTASTLYQYIGHASHNYTTEGVGFLENVFSKYRESQGTLLFLIHIPFITQERGYSKAILKCHSWLQWKQ